MGDLIKLPNNLASRILELELLVEQQLNEVTLGQLLAAYSVSAPSITVSHQPLLRAP